MTVATGDDELCAGEDGIGAERATGGVNAVMCDGSLDFLSFSMDLHTFATLGSIAGADGEGRHLVEEEVEPVIVVEHHGNLGLLAPEEVVDRAEAIEERLPVARTLIPASRREGRARNRDARRAAGPVW